MLTYDDSLEKVVEVLMDGISRRKTPQQLLDGSKSDQHDDNANDMDNAKTINSELLFTANTSAYNNTALK